MVVCASNVLLSFQHSLVLPEFRGQFHAQFSSDSRNSCFFSCLIPAMQESVNFGHKLMPRTPEKSTDANCNEALSVQKLAQLLNVSQRTARRIIESGELKAHRIGRQWRVFYWDFRQYLDRASNAGSVVEGSRANQ